MALIDARLALTLVAQPVDGLASSSQHNQRVRPQESARPRSVSRGFLPHIALCVARRRTITARKGAETGGRAPESGASRTVC